MTTHPALRVVICSLQDGQLRHHMELRAQVLEQVAAAGVLEEVGRKGGDHGQRVGRACSVM